MVAAKDAVSSLRSIRIEPWRAAVLVETGKPLELWNIEPPRIDGGQVLVQVSYSSICRSQLLEVSGGRGADPWLPHLLGHEAVGEVVAVGSQVTKVSPGDAVILGWIRGTGIDTGGQTLVSSSGFWLNAGPVTTFSEFTVVAENRVYHKPAGVPDFLAPAFGCALLTGGGMVTRQSRPEMDSAVLVNGFGGVGIGVVLGLKSLGVEFAVADVSPARRGLAIDLGACAVLDPSNPARGFGLPTGTSRSFDFVYECTGSIRAMRWAFDRTARNGTMLFASHPPSGDLFCIDPHELISGKVIRGTWGGDSEPDQDIPEIAQALNPTIAELLVKDTRVYPLSQINEALRDLESGEVVRPLIDMSGDEV